VDNPITIAGIEMHRGECAVLVGPHEAFHDWLMPVVVIDTDGALKVTGTVCVSVPARSSRQGTSSTTCSTSAPKIRTPRCGSPGRPAPANAFHGQMLAVEGYR
jgi:hypothetical protein